MKGELQELMHFTGTPGYFIAKIDNIRYKVFDRKIWGYCWSNLKTSLNNPIHPPIKINFKLNDKKEIIFLRRQSKERIKNETN